VRRRFLTLHHQSLAAHWINMDDQKKIYEEFLEHAMHLLNDHQKPIELVAGSMIAIAQRLYKTQLTQEEYEEMMDTIRNARVKPYKFKKETVH
jgi:hypothetical protein|tara:strand:+ start:2100 stop:2378 length:279 start_codon:yes stop_codon:yes gene_type:complete